MRTEDLTRGWVILNTVGKGITKLIPGEKDGY